MRKMKVCDSPADVPGLGPVLELRSLVAHVEHLAQGEEVRLVRKELTVVLGVVERRTVVLINPLEELEAEHVGRRPVLRSIRYNNRNTCTEK